MCSANYKTKNIMTAKEHSEDLSKRREEAKALHIGGVVRSADVSIVGSDIATIEALHDLLLDAHGYSLDFITLKRARELTKKMYDAFK
jgi:hypothetical protein